MGAKVIKLEVHMGDIPLAARTGMSIGGFSISSDIKKIVRWYNILQENNMLDQLEEEAQVEADEEE